MQQKLHLFGQVQDDLRIEVSATESLTGSMSIGNESSISNQI